VTGIGNHDEGQAAPAACFHEKRCTICSSLYSVANRCGTSFNLR
jgi:hypothetical protein